jgi:hypothetical protein
VKNDAARERLIEYVKQKDWVSFVEVERVLSEFMEVKGTTSIQGAPNVILWMGVSEDLADLILELVNEGVLFLWRTQFLTYLIDGRGLTLPIAKRPPKEGYKKPRWLPTCLRGISQV